MQTPPDKPHAELYRELLRQMEHADQVGFDVYSVIEHHFFPEFSISANPLALICAAAQRTRRLRFRVALHTLPLCQPDATGRRDRRGRHPDRRPSGDRPGPGTRLAVRAQRRRSGREPRPLRGGGRDPAPGLDRGQFQLPGPVLSLQGPDRGAEAVAAAAPAAVRRRHQPGHLRDGRPARLGHVPAAAAALQGDAAEHRRLPRRRRAGRAASRTSSTFAPSTSATIPGRSSARSSRALLNFLAFNASPVKGLPPQRS